MLRDAYSYVPQSTVADVALKGMVNLYERLPKGCDIVFNIHDEIVIQVLLVHPPIVKPGILSLGIENSLIVHKIEELMIRCMSIPLEINGKKFIIPVGVKVGKNWNEVS